jgi:hypothetical protein
MRGYSLTTRLTALFSLTSACVLLGLGVLIFTAMDRHFAVEDYALLRDNMRLVENHRRQHRQHVAHAPGGRLPASQRTPGLYARHQRSGALRHAGFRLCRSAEDVD